MWRRVEAGSHRSSDDRFELGSEGSGRWFLIDHAEHAEQAQPHTEGPFPSLDAAKDAAGARRARPPEASPLAERIAGAGRHSAQSRARPERPSDADDAPARDPVFPDRRRPSYRPRR